MNIDYTKVNTYVLNARKATSNCYDKNGRFLTRREMRKIIYKQNDPLFKYKSYNYDVYANTNSSKFAKNAKKKRFIK